MASAGLTVKDLQGPALERLAIKDSRDLLLIEGVPPHSRASEAKALVADSLKSEAYRIAFDRETAEWATPGVGRLANIRARRTERSAGPRERITRKASGCEARRQGPPVSRTSCPGHQLDAFGRGHRREAPRDSSA